MPRDVVCILNDCCVQSDHLKHISEYSTLARQAQRLCTQISCQALFGIHALLFHKMRGKVPIQRGQIVQHRTIRPDPRKERRAMICCACRSSCPTHRSGRPRRGPRIHHLLSLRRLRRNKRQPGGDGSGFVMRRLRRGPKQEPDQSGMARHEDDQQCGARDRPAEFAVASGEPHGIHSADGTVRGHSQRKVLVFFG